MQRLLRCAVVLAATSAMFACQQSTPPRQPQTTTTGQSSSNPNKTNPYVVLGKRYVPLKNAAGYHERGVASWYGPKFHGRPTANGEKFNMNKMTAAHKTLPLPVYAEVTNLRNGRRVVVRINDRGPFVDNRLIDLSRAAAHELDMVGPGTTLVDVRIIPGPGGGPVAPVSVKAATLPNAFYVQVGAFGDASNASRVAAALRSAGFADVRIEPLTRSAATLHRVRVGPVASVDQFDAYITRLNALGYREARLAVE